MKKFLLFLLCFVSVTTAFGASLTIDSSNVGDKSVTGTSVSSVKKTFGDDITITIVRNSTYMPGFYTSNGVLRYYGTDVMTISSEYTITKLEFAMYGGTPTNASSGSITGSDKSFSWSGSATSISFTGDGTTRINALTITYTKDGEEPPVVLPAVIFSPAAGGVVAGTEVTMSLDGASLEDYKIYYTTDNTDPDENSPSYNGEAIVINEDTTIKAIVYDDELNASEIYSASYTIEDPLVCKIVFANQGWTSNPYSASNKTKDWTASNGKVFATTFSFNGSGSTYPYFSSPNLRLYYSNNNQVKIDAPDGFVIVGIESTNKAFNIAEVTESSEQTSYVISNKASITLRPSTANKNTDYTDFTITLAEAGSVPTITTHVAAISLEAVDMNAESNTATITVTAANIGEAPTYALAEGANSPFTVSGTLTAEGGTLTVALSSTDTKGLFKDNLTITAGELSQTVALTGFVNGVWTVDELSAILDTYNSNETSEYNYTTEGIITRISNAWDPSYSNISYYIADSSISTTSLLVFRAVCADGTDGAALKVGDRVSVNGNLTKYFTTPEFATGSVTTLISAGGQYYALAGSASADFVLEDGQYVAANVEFAEELDNPWFYILDNNGNIYGAEASGTVISEEAAQTVVFGNNYSWDIAEGNYNVIFDPETMQVSVIKNVVVVEDITIYFDNSVENWAKPTVGYITTSKYEMTFATMTQMGGTSETPAEIARFSAPSANKLPELEGGKVWDVQVYKAVIPSDTQYVVFTDNYPEYENAYALEDENFNPILPTDGMIYSTDGNNRLYSEDTVTGVEAIVADNQTEAVYYNLQGVRVATPAPGNIYIQVRGTQVTKIRK